jgi:hypothetical protein
MDEVQDNGVSKVKEELRVLSLYLHNELYLQVYNKIKTFLKTSGVYKGIQPLEGITRDELKSVVAYRIVEELVYDPLVPVYLFSDRAFDCVRWMKGVLKGQSADFAEVLLSCQMMVLQENFSQKEQHVKIILNEMESFNYTQSDDAPIHAKDSWMTFFGKEHMPANEVMEADLNVLGFVATPELQLAKMIRENPTTALRVVQELFPLQAQPTEQVEKSEKAPDSTMARQVLIMYFLLKHAQVRGIDASVKARFIQYLIGKDYKNIYDHIRNPLSTKTGNFRKKDLQEIRTLFEQLGLTEIVKMINNELEVKED